MTTAENGLPSAVPYVLVAPARTDATERERRALDTWARRRGIALVAAAPGGATAAESSSRDASTPASRRAIVADVERDLARAREAIVATDADTAERALARAARLLREHPALPQAAWLKAEVERGWAARFATLEPADGERAHRAWGRAEALDRGRIAGVGERGPLSDDADGPARVQGDAPNVTVHFAWARDASAEVRTQGTAERSAELWIDGRLVPPDAQTVPLAPGEHAVVVVEEGRPTFAAWIGVAPGMPPVRLPVLGLSCSREALGRAVREGGRVQASGVQCPRWVAAFPGREDGEVWAALCGQDRCEPAVPLRTDGIAGNAGTRTGGQRAVDGEDAVGTTKEGREAGERKATRKGFPAWAAWTLVGVGVVAITAGILAASGVFEPPPVERRFVTGGVETTSHRGGLHDPKGSPPLLSPVLSP